MSVVSRFMHTNLARSAATTLSASSADSAHPVSWLRSQLLSKAYRSKFGWTIVAGLNDKVDFNRGGVKSATIAPGTYATAADLCAAIVAALVAADATPAWACSYDSGTHKFTISTAAHAFTLLWSTGTNKSTNCAPETGFAYADTSSATSQTGSSAVYQSRHFVGFDFGSGQSPLAFAVRGHNGSSSATFSVGKSAVTAIAAASSVVAVPIATLAGTDPAVAFISAGGAARQYWALVISDCGNSDGFSEVGVVFIGDYVQPGITYESEPRSVEDLSTGSEGASGADFNVERAQRQAWEIVYSAAESADFALLEALRLAAPGGKCWFFAMDAVTNPTTTTRYGYIARGSWHDEDLGAGQRDVGFTFVESLP